MDKEQTLALEELGKIETVKIYNQAYVDKQQKRIAELEAQIEKMKNCFNCAKGDWDNRVKCIKSGCVNKDKWEIKEND